MKNRFIIVSLILIFPFSISIYIYRKYLQNRNSITCINNLRKLHISILQYSNDYDQTFPTESAWNERKIEHNSIPGCPEATAMPVMNPPLLSGGIPGYSYNRILGSGHKKFTDCKYPGFSILCLDYATGFPTIFNVNPYGPVIKYPKSLESGWKRHHGGGNYLFVDGHVRWLTEKNIIEPETENGHTGGNAPTFGID